MAGKIKMTIGTNGAVDMNMKGFKSCAEKTKELAKSMQVTIDEVTINEGDEAVQTVTKNKVNVKA